jgi:hypothetical protein
MKTIKYFVSYNFTQNGDNGVGCTEVILKKKLESLEEIQLIINHIKEQNSYDSVVILFWKEF